MKRVYAIWEALPDSPVNLTAWMIRNPAVAAVIIASVVVAVSAIVAALGKKDGLVGKSGTGESGPIRVEPRGGLDATLVIHNDGQTATFTGMGRIVAEDSQMPVTRQREYRNLWLQPGPKYTQWDKIANGHFATLMLARAEYDGPRMHIYAYGDDGNVDSWELKMRGLIGMDNPTVTGYYNLKRVRFNVSLRADPALATTWSRAFDVTWNGKTRQFTVTEA
jgi:hypothetical protein